jgi:nicotinate-nucleotide pyrophosphorylase (carboxylating)
MSVYDHSDVTELIALALREDLGEAGDITCASLVPKDSRLRATVTAKAEGVVCGLELFRRTFAALRARGLGAVEIAEAAADGTRVKPGTVVWRADGDASALLQGERTALNLCQRLSGTASLARRYADLVAGTRAAVFDTRKTAPGMRLLQKHAVVAGGGRNHRIGLYDQVLIKDNHIALMVGRRGASAPAEAVRRCRAALGEQVIVEVEIERLDDLEPTIAAGADIVLLDNMGVDLLRDAVRRRDIALKSGGAQRRIELEASGGITLATVRAVAETGVERISTGELTHSAPALDLSMRCAPI